MKKPVTNYGKSIKTRLLNLMNEKGYKYPLYNQYWLQNK